MAELLLADSLALSYIKSNQLFSMLFLIPMLSSHPFHSLISYDKANINLTRTLDRMVYREHSRYEVVYIYTTSYLESIYHITGREWTAI